MSNSVQVSSTTSEKKPSFPRWVIVMLIILAIPVGLPLMISLLVVPISLVFSFAVAGFAAIVAGIASLISVPFVVFSDFGSGVFIFGTGLMSIGFGIILILVNYNLVKFLFRGVKYIWNKLINREDKHGYGNNFEGGVAHGQ